jgi:hypothetical protein
MGNGLLWKMFFIWSSWNGKFNRPRNQQKSALRPKHADGIRHAGRDRAAALNADSSGGPRGAEGLDFCVSKANRPSHNGVQTESPTYRL